jgi:hypothetical protein
MKILEIDIFLLPHARRADEATVKSGAGAGL